MVQSMKGDEDFVPSDVYILARVYDVDMKQAKVSKVSKKGKGKECAKTVFVVDPWEYYHADKLVLKHDGQFVGSIV